MHARSLHPPYELAVLMMDIDHFKTVNDRYSHQAGDVVLQEIAVRLRDNLCPQTSLPATAARNSSLSYRARPSTP